MEISPRKMSGKEAQLMFQQILSFPLQGVCKVLKRIGGQWLDYSKSGLYKQVDGDKYICMDNISNKTPCLVKMTGPLRMRWTALDAQYMHMTILLMLLQAEDIGSHFISLV